MSTILVLYYSAYGHMGTGAARSSNRCNRRLWTPLAVRSGDARLTVASNRAKKEG